MVKTYIPITHARVNNFLPSAKKVQFGMVLLLAIMTGFFAGISSPSMIPTDPRSLLGAVSESKAETAPTVNSESVDTAALAHAVRPEEPTSVTAQSETFSAAQFFAPTDSTKSREELELLIMESELAINRDTNEVTRIRNASVAIVSEFETNCGDWEDDCAVYYSRALERNNSTYNDLVQKIEHEMRVLEELRNEISLI